jgi:hypothetical protein
MQSMKQAVIQDVESPIHVIQKKRDHRDMENKEQTKVKYTHSRHTLRFPFEHQLKH